MSKMPAIVRITGTALKEEHTTSDGKIHIGPGGAGKAARHLIATGHDPRRRMNVMRDDKIVLRGTIHSFALKAWAGSDKDPMLKSWQPPTIGEVEPMAAPLARWWAAVQAGRGR